MAWFERSVEREPSVPSFRQCPGCTYDFLTGEGTRSCSWYVCPYLPEELDVFCPQCNFNFATREGTRRCDDRRTCEWAPEGFRRARAARSFFAQAD